MLLVAGWEYRLHYCNYIKAIECLVEDISFQSTVSHKGPSYVLNLDFQEAASESKPMCKYKINSPRKKKRNKKYLQLMTPAPPPRNILYRHPKPKLQNMYLPI